MRWTGAGVLLLALALLAAHAVPTASGPAGRLNPVSMPYAPGILILVLGPQLATYDRKIAADGNIRVEFDVELNGVVRHSETRDYATSGRWVHFQTQVDMRPWGLIEGDQVTTSLAVTRLAGPYAGVRSVERLAMPVGRATVDPCAGTGDGGIIIPLPAASPMNP